MDSTKFQKCGYQLVDWAVKYMETLHERRPLPDVEPGWLRNVCPKNAPVKPEGFDRIMRDIEPVVLEGMAHWQHPQFFSYFPAGNSWASIMGDVLSNATGVNGRNWNTCPVLSELELTITDWCCKFLNLPKFFLSKYSCPDSEGRGIIQHSASESIFYSMVWAREDALKKLRQKYPNTPKAILLNQLVAYYNAECHPCVEKAAHMGLVRSRKLSANREGVVKGDMLRSAIEEDLADGLIPFFHTAIIGSTGMTTFDDLLEVGPVCEEYGIWLHCDAAYAGSCFACPEMRYLLHGYEYVWSTNINTNKWMLCNFEASLHWIRYSSKSVAPMVGWDEELLQTMHLPDYKHFAMPETRRFRALKLWFVIRNYGVDGLRRYCRKHINLAKLFEKYVRRDERFEVCGSVNFGLVSFRLRGLNIVNSKLLDGLNFSRRIHMMHKLDLHHAPTHFQDKVVLRLALCAEHATEKDIDEAWRTISIFASVLLRQYEQDMADHPAMQNLYNMQKHRDQLDLQSKTGKGNLISSEEMENEATIAYLKLRKRRSSKAAGIIHGVGTWKPGSGIDIFQKFDEYLEDNPEVIMTNLGHSRNMSHFSTRDHSMLHWNTLAETRANVDKIMMNKQYQN